tara:strand:- start:282 stop:458 length:177 start_codon:yes stop_codon:yes gene_type:complete
MNQETKLMYALEHIAHLEDIFEDLTDEALLQASLRDIKLIVNRQLSYVKQRKIRFSNL